MKRRSFLGTLIAAASVPSFLKADKKEENLFNKKKTRLLLMEFFVWHTLNTLSSRVYLTLVELAMELSHPKHHHLEYVK